MDNDSSLIIPVASVRPWSDSTIVDEFYEDVLPFDATHYHIYAAEWTPTQIEFYVDNQKLRTIDQSPSYAMHSCWESTSVHMQQVS